MIIYLEGTSPPDKRTERHSTARTVLIGPLSTSYGGVKLCLILGSGDGVWVFYDCLGKMLLSTEAGGFKAQAELILELQLGLQNRHVELHKC